MNNKAWVLFDNKVFTKQVFFFFFIVCSLPVILAKKGCNPHKHKCTHTPLESFLKLGPVCPFSYSHLVFVALQICASLLCQTAS